VIPTSKWDGDHIARWVTRVAGGSLSSYSAAFGPSATGAVIRRWPRARFLLICQEEADMAQSQSGSISMGVKPSVAGEMLYDDLHARMAKETAADEQRRKDRVALMKGGKSNHTNTNATTTPASHNRRRSNGGSHSSARAGSGNVTNAAHVARSIPPASGRSRSTTATTAGGDGATSSSSSNANRLKSRASAPTTSIPTSSLSSPAVAASSSTRISDSRHHITVDDPYLHTRENSVHVNAYGNININSHVHDDYSSHQHMHMQTAAPAPVVSHQISAPVRPIASHATNNVNAPTSTTTSSTTNNSRVNMPLPPATDAQSRRHRAFAYQTSIRAPAKSLR
jgi:hypothetical protein